MSTIIVDKTRALSYLTGPIVKIVVGEVGKSQTFFAHQDLLISRSKFFKKALKLYAAPGETESATHGESELDARRWREGDAGVVLLPEDQPEIFSLYISLLYSGSVPLREEPKKEFVMNVAAGAILASEELCEEIARIASYEQVALAKLYVFCEKIQDLKAKRASMSAMVESIQTVRDNGHQYWPTDEVVLTIYNGTMSSDPMREFLIDCTVIKGGETWIEQDASAYHVEYLRDLAYALLKYRPPPQNIKGVNIKDAARYCEKIKPVKDETDETNDKAFKTSDDTTVVV